MEILLFRRQQTELLLTIMQLGYAMVINITNRHSGTYGGATHIHGVWQK
ncbi:MAG: hypothetical protein J6V33_01530 [Bacteroidales bacterium]|nr:hypothetical protein [Bacteroidales bacterium]